MRDRAAEIVRNARAVGVCRRVRRAGVHQVVLVEQLEDLGRDEDDEHPRIRRVASAEQEDDQPDHQRRGQLDSTQQGDALEQRMKVFNP